MSETLAQFASPLPAPGLGGPVAGGSDQPAPSRAGPRKPLLDEEHARLFATWLSPQTKNLALLLDEVEQGLLADRAKREYEIDDHTRDEWKKKYKEWLRLAMQIAEEKTYPWPGASNVLFPLLTVAAVQFNARAYPAIVQGRNVVKGAVLGDDNGTPLISPQTGQPIMGPAGQPMWQTPPGAKQARADRIGRHMSWQLLTEQREWEEQTDRLLLLLAITGTMFRKTYYDSASQRNVSETVDALRLVVNYHAKSFEVAPRYSEEIDFYPWQIESNIRAGLWLDHDYGSNEDSADDEDAPVTFVEQHRRYDLDRDGYAEPVIVTFSKFSGRLARIMPGFDEEGIEAVDDGRVMKIEPVRFYTRYGFVPSPDGGVYDVGLGSLLYPLNHAVNSSLNQMFDAGHLANAGGGFIGGGMSMNTGAVRFSIGEYKVVQTPGQELRANLVPLPFPGPNPTLLALLQFLVESAKEVGSIKDILTGEMPGANVPGILGLAVIQQGLKVFSATFKRVYRGLRAEYEKLFRLNRLYLPDEAGFRIGAEYFEISRADYEEGAGVEPVADPDMVTDVQRMAQGNFLLQFANDPWFNAREIRLRALQAAAIDQIDKLLVQQPPGNPEIMAKAAELQLRQHEVALRDKELNIRAAREEGDLDIRRGKDKASEIQMLSSAILNLANARKADSEVDQRWYDLQIQALRQQVEALNASSESEPAANSPAAAGGGGTAPAGAGGPPGSGVPGLAPPPGDQGGAALPGGLSGLAGGGLAG